LRPLGPALGRVLVVLAAYAVFALVVLGGAGFLSRVLVLPALFDRIVTGAVVLGLPLAAVLAWRYPSVGDVAPHAGSAGGE
jgi:hypothetical protein